MADNFRQTPSDKVMAAMKPDSQKPLTERIGDNIAGETDKFASHAQPESNKSTTQKIIDTVTPGNDAHREHHVGNRGRQGPLDATRAAIVPDSMKSDSQVAKDYTAGKADNVGSHVQPQENKGIVQKIKDFVTPGGSSHTHEATHTHNTSHTGQTGDLTGSHSGHAADNYRQGPGDKLSDAIKPDAFKSNTEIQHDHLKGKADNAAGSAVPHENKSVGQKIADGLNPKSSA